MKSMNTKYWPTIALCLLVWVTVLVARTHPFNPMGMERVFAIGVVAICWLTIGIVIERIRNERK